MANLMKMDKNNFIKALSTSISSDRLKTRSIDVYAYASDAGFYEILPIAVCFPISEQEISEIVFQSRAYQVPITFRGGGTSLSGQTVGEGIIVDLSRAWKKVEVLDGAVRVQPGVTGGVVNQYLKKHAQKIGPDPSSINSAMMGGILSNNASGMCCGVSYNSYHTLRYIRFMLSDGHVYNTELEADYTRFEKEQQQIANTLSAIRQEIINNEILEAKIRHKYKIKNTVGYGLNSFLDYEHPLDILAHLLIGAEGTLGFIAEAVLKTLPDKPFKATSLLVFDNIKDACKAITPLKNLGAESLELMDRASIASVERMKGLPEYVKLLPKTAAALLCEFQGFTEEAIDDSLNQVQNLHLPVIQNLEFTKSSEEQALLWKIRKGMFPAVGAIRAKGTTVVLEDIAFPVELLADAVEDLQQLFKKYGYDNAIIFGHAKDGNLHFVITQSFDTKAEVDRYAAFMDDVVALVVHKYDGSLKAEHGTGRNMAPFVKTEWGEEAYEIMKRLKHVIDPHHIFNRGVIINTDAHAHLKDLKKYPVVEDEVDKCIECGFCEQNCPSRALTLTPRKRIVIRRAQKKLAENGEHRLATELDLYYQYDGMETCAVDGMCANDCPVQINTGDLIKKLRKEQNSVFARGMATLVAKNLRFTEAMLSMGFRSYEKSKKILKGLSLFKNIPDMVRSSKYTQKPESDRPDFLVFSSCVSRIMTNQEIHDQDYILFIARSLGIGVATVPLKESICCGQAFASKGFEKAGEIAQRDAVDRLLKLTDNGRMPIVVDVSSCSQQFMNYSFKDKVYQERYRKLKFLDSIDFAHDYILPKLKVVKKLEKVTLHPNCSTFKMNKVEKFKNVAQSIAHEVHIPIYATCCAMAGDRGFLVPELTSSAVSHQNAEVIAYDAPYHCSTSVTCNINLSANTGKQYESLYSLIHKIL